MEDYVYELLNGEKLTKAKFISYFENKVFKTIRKYKLIKFDDKICVALSGGKDSIALLYLLNKYMKKRKIENNLFALLVDEGIKNYRDETIVFAKKFCNSLGIKLFVKSYKKEFKTTQDRNMKILKSKKLNISSCNICGTFRRYILNKYSRELKATKVATGHNIDDESQNILLNIFKNNFKILARLGVSNGVVENEKFIQRIKPLYFCLEKEVKLYTFLKGFNINYSECPYSKDTFRDELTNILNELEDKHKGIKYGVVNFFLEMEKFLKERHVKLNNENINLCEKCGEPTEKKVCNACTMEEIVNGTN